MGVYREASRDLFLRTHQLIQRTFIAYLFCARIKRKAGRFCPHVVWGFTGRHILIMHTEKCKMAIVMEWYPREAQSATGTMKSSDQTRLKARE